MYEKLNLQNYDISKKKYLGYKVIWIKIKKGNEMKKKPVLCRYSNETGYSWPIFHTTFIYINEILLEIPI